jgi:transposase
MDTPVAVLRLIIMKLNEGLTQREIAVHLNVTQSVVARTVLHYKKTGHWQTIRKGKCGWKQSLSPHLARIVARESLKNPRATARQIRQAVGGSVTAVSLDTLRRSLNRSGRKAFRPVKSPSWTPSQMRVRLLWARRYSKWSAQQWQKVRKLVVALLEKINTKMNMISWPCFHIHIHAGHFLR